MFTPRDEAWYRKMAPYSAALIVVFSLGMLVTVARTNLAVRIACLIGMILAMPAIGFVCYRKTGEKQILVGAALAIVLVGVVMTILALAILRPL